MAAQEKYRIHGELVIANVIVVMEEDMENVGFVVGEGLNRNRGIRGTIRN